MNLCYVKPSGLWSFITDKFIGNSYDYLNAGSRDGFLGPCLHFSGSGLISRNLQMSVFTLSPPLSCCSKLHEAYPVQPIQPCTLHAHPSTHPQPSPLHDTHHFLTSQKNQLFILSCLLSVSLYLSPPCMKFHFFKYRDLYLFHLLVCPKHLKQYLTHSRAK